MQTLVQRDVLAGRHLIILYFFKCCNMSLTYYDSSKYNMYCNSVKSLLCSKHDEIITN